MEKLRVYLNEMKKMQKNTFLIFFIYNCVEPSIPNRIFHIKYRYFTIIKRIEFLTPNFLFIQKYH